MHYAAQHCTTYCALHCILYREIAVRLYPPSNARIIFPPGASPDSRCVSCANPAAETLQPPSGSPAAYDSLHVHGHGHRSRGKENGRAYSSSSSNTNERRICIVRYGTIYSLEHSRVCLLYHSTTTRCSRKPDLDVKEQHPLPFPVHSLTASNPADTSTSSG